MAHVLGTAANPIVIDAPPTQNTTIQTRMSLKDQFQDDIMNAILKYAEADGRRIASCNDLTQVSYIMWDICCLLHGGSSSNPYLEQERVRRLKDEGFRLISPFLKTFFSKWAEHDSKHDLSPLWENQHMFYSSTSAHAVCQWFEFYKVNCCN